MNMFITYLLVFVTGGIVCLLGQILINKTHITSARILVLFLLIGAVLEALGIFGYIEEFGKAGITIPITGFGKTLVRGAIIGAAEEGFIGALKGGMAAVAGALSVAIISSFIFAMIFKSKTKK